MCKIFKITIFSLAIFFALPVYAAPSITGVNGVISDGNQIEISGDEFGTTGPSILLFDNFERGINEIPIAIGENSATIGQWSESAISTVNGYPVYSNANKVSGNLAFRANAISGTQSVVTYLPENGQQKLFISWWMLLPEGNNIPGEQIEEPTDLPINWKTIWVTGEDTNHDDQVIPTILPGSTPPYGISSFIVGNNSLYHKWITLDFLKGRWMRLWCYIDGGTGNNDGTMQHYELTSSGVQERANDVNVNVLNAGGIYERIILNGYNRATENCYPTFDDVYISYGDHARARIEIGNEPSYNNCTNLTIITPTAWSDSSVTATVRQGSFGSGEQAYLFVVDENGDASEGYPITFGEGSGDAIPPLSPTGLSIS